MVDGAITIAIRPGNLAVAIVTPVVAPLITHEPIVEPCVLRVLAIADDDHVMKSVSTALIGVNNAMRVVLEDILTRINQHRYGLLGNSGYHGSWVVWW